MLLSRNSHTHRYKKVWGVGPNTYLTFKRRKKLLPFCCSVLLSPQSTDEICEGGHVTCRVTNPTGIVSVPFRRREKHCQSVSLKSRPKHILTLAAETPPGLEWKRQSAAGFCTNRSSVRRFPQSLSIWSKTTCMLVLSKC